MTRGELYEAQPALRWLDRAVAQAIDYLLPFEGSYGLVRGRGEGSAMAGRAHSIAFATGARSRIWLFRNAATASLG